MGGYNKRTQKPSVRKKTRKAPNLTLNMSPKEPATTSGTPAASSEVAACSREEPVPKLKPEISRGADIVVLFGFAFEVVLELVLGVVLGVDFGDDAVEVEVGLVRLVVKASAAVVGCTQGSIKLLLRFCNTPLAF